MVMHSMQKLLTVEKPEGFQGNRGNSRPDKSKLNGTEIHEVPWSESRLPLYVDGLCPFKLGFLFVGPNSE